MIKTIISMLMVINLYANINENETSELNKWIENYQKEQKQKEQKSTINKQSNNNINISNIAEPFKQIIPYIAIFLILGLFKNPINKYFKKLKNNKQNKMTPSEKKEKGNDYELLVGKFYKKQGYKIYQKGIEENFKDGGIDIIATKENETILIQCKNWNIDGKYKIRQKEIREFYGACNFYIEDENLDKNKIICIYVVPDDKLISINSKAMFKRYYNKCRYVIIKKGEGSD